MSSKSLQSVPASVRDLFMKPPLLASEDPKLYYQLLEKFIEQEQPKTVVEWLLVKDLVDHAWEAMRMRHLKAPLIDLERRLAMSAVLRKLRPSDAQHHSENQRIATEWMSDRKVCEEAMMILAQSGLDHECVTATAVTSAAKALEAVDKFEGTAVARRDAAMRELQRQREEVLVSSHNGPLIDAEQTSQTSKMGGKA